MNGYKKEEENVLVVLRDRLIDDCLKHGEKELFLKLTSPDWEQYLCKEKEIHCVVKQPTKEVISTPREKIYYESNEQLVNEQNLNDFLQANSLAATYIEKKIFINELLNSKKQLNSDLYLLLEKINADETLLFMCQFVTSKEKLNGVFYCENGQFHFKDNQSYDVKMGHVDEVLDYYQEQDFDFFVCIDEQITHEEARKVML